VISDVRHPAGARGVVVAARKLAADAGAAALVAGGTAIDAAVATAFALCVVDPANCGLGGYGGFMTYAPPAGEPVVVDFNTWVPDRVDPASFRLPGDVSELDDGGRSVAPPMVVPGLLAAHERFGRLPLADVVAPAVRLAREGFPICNDLVRAMNEKWERTGGARPELGRIFYPDGRPLTVGSHVVQTDLAATIETIAAKGASSFTAGPIVEAICAATSADGGFLEPADFARNAVGIGPPESVTFGSATVHGPRRETSGAGVLFSALTRLEPDRLGANRSRAYVAELTRALKAAWDERTADARAALNARHTTTLAAADAEGGLVALTFTHGALWFGSGILVPGTGIVLNAGANLFASGPVGPLALVNMAPIVVEEADGTAHAAGATGGPRIPGILLSAVVDVVHYGSALEAAIAAPHLSVRPLDGTLEGEPDLLELAGGGSPIGPGDFGPASGVTRAAGGLVPAGDPRFDPGVAVA
jgi:gamma-glutamyltranspeptidase / glutathione hydrolase